MSTVEFFRLQCDGGCGGGRVHPGEGMIRSTTAAGSRDPAHAPVRQRPNLLDLQPSHAGSNPVGGTVRTNETEGT